MALRLKPETREAWQRKVAEFEQRAAEWRPVPRAEPAAEKPKSLSRFDIYHEAWVDSEL